MHDRFLIEEQYTEEDGVWYELWMRWMDGSWEFIDSADDRNILEALRDNLAEDK